MFVQYLGISCEQYLFLAIARRFYSTSTSLQKPVQKRPHRQQKWTPGEIAKLRKCGEAGWSISEIVLEFPNRTFDSVRRRWNRDGFYGVDRTLKSSRHWSPEEIQKPVQSPRRRQMWTPDEIAKLRKCGEAGWKLKETVREFPDRSFDSVRRRYNLEGFCQNDRSEKRTKNWSTEEDDIIRNGLKGHGTISSLVTLADKMGRSMWSVHRRLRRLNGGDRISGSQLINQSKPWTDAELNDAKSWRNEGQTYPQIAARLGRTSDAVMQIRSSDRKDRRKPAITHTSRENTEQQLVNDGTGKHYQS